MEDLKDYAIILIYPDGEVEEIPITTYPYHSAYFIEHLEKSERFKKLLITYGISLIGCIHYNISIMLAMQGVIEISNKDISVKIQNPDYYKAFNPEFYFFLPNNLGDLK